jgi:major intracellular serine protease
MDNKVRLLPYKINQYRGDLMAVPYGVKMIKADNLWDKSQKGEGIVIAIIDTGCDINH